MPIAGVWQHAIVIGNSVFHLPRADNREGDQGRGRARTVTLRQALSACVEVEEIWMAPNTQHVDNIDQLSSTTILGVALIGALLTIGAYLLLGS